MTTSDVAADPAYGSLAHRFGSMRGFQALVGGNRVTLLHDGAECFPAMLAAIAAARSEVLLEMYWFASDDIGRRFAAALMERARAGCTVCVIYDAVGSLEADEAMFDEMRAAGCLVHEYNPIAPWRQRFRFAVVNNRDHRKMLMVDGCVGFTGGVNIGDQWQSLDEGGEGWRDDMVRIEGPAVRQMRGVFMDTWNDFLAEPEARPLPAATEGGEEGCGVRVLANHYLGERRAIRRAYLRRISGAEKRIFITNSYFVPDRSIRLALARAVRRGAEVRVIVPGESDVPAVFYAGRRLYPWLLRRGIHLHEWQGTVLHAKTAVIDGRWCTVGTYNLDYRSLRFNREVTASIDDPLVGQAMEKRFEQDLGQAPPVDLRSFRFRPLSERLLENFFYLFRRLL